MSLVYTLLALVGANGPEAAEAAVRPISTADHVLAIIAEDHGLRRDAGPQLIFAAWADGRVIWSENPVKGGAPYRGGKIAPERITAALERVKQDGLFDNARLTRPHLGPDANFTTLIVASGKQRLKMQSWHERFEANANLVATAHGIVPLEGRRRYDVLAAEPAEYLHYRLVWDEVRVACQRLIPVESRPAAGTLVLESREFSWHESADPPR